MRFYYYFMLVLAMVILPRLSAISEESDLSPSVAISDDGKVVIAIRPYFSRKDKGDFYLSGSLSKTIPVGMMIQNYSDRPISIDRISVKSSKGRRIYVPQYTPYGDRTVGAIAGRDFFTDGEDLNKLLHQKYMPSQKRPTLGVNEVFYKDNLEPGASFYGLVYLSRRDKHFVPMWVKGIDDLAFEVTFYRSDSASLHTATLFIDDKSTNITKRFEQSKKENCRFQCSGEQCDKMSPTAFRNTQKDLLDCFAMSLGKNGNRPATADMWGKYSVAWINFDADGNYLSHELTKSSKNKHIDEALDKVAKGMEHCDLSYAMKGETQYRIMGVVGDSVAAEELEGRVEK